MIAASVPSAEKVAKEIMESFGQCARYTDEINRDKSLGLFNVASINRRDILRAEIYERLMEREVKVAERQPKSESIRPISAYKKEYRAHAGFYPITVQKQMRRISNNPISICVPRDFIPHYKSAQGKVLSVEPEYNSLVLEPTRGVAHWLGSIVWVAMADRDGAPLVDFSIVK